MDHRYFSLFDMAIVAIPVTVVGVWQLVSVSREIARDQAAKDRPGKDDPAG